jgi:hypothetical protein
VLALQQTVGNAAVARVLARDTRESIREEVAGALGVKPDDPRVDVQMTLNEEVLLALKAAELAARQPEQQPAAEPGSLPDAYGGLGIKEFLRRQRLELIRQEMEKAGLTDEMIAKGFRQERRATIAGIEMVSVFEFVPEGKFGRTIHTFEQRRGGTTKRTVTTRDLNKGGEDRVVISKVEGGTETVVTQWVVPGTGPLAEKAALAKTSTRWVKNPDGTVTVETLDAYGRPIKGRSWKTEVFQTPQERLRSAP